MASLGLVLSWLAESASDVRDRPAHFPKGPTDPPKPQAGPVSHDGNDVAKVLGAEVMREKVENGARARVDS